MDLCILYERILNVNHSTIGAEVIYCAGKRGRAGRAPFWIGVLVLLKDLGTVQSQAGSGGGGMGMV